MSKIVITVLAIVLFAGVSFAKDEKIAISQVPEVVKSAVFKVFPDIQLKKAEIEKKKGEVVYELKGVVDGKLYEFKINENGELLKMKLEKDDDDEEHEKMHKDHHDHHGHHGKKDDDDDEEDDD